MINYLRVFIGATTKQEAVDILQVLLKKKLITGGKYIKAVSMHRWKGNIDHEPYYNVVAYTIAKKQDEIIEVVAKMHSDEVPAIYYDKIDYGSKPFLKWIGDSID